MKKFTLPLLISTFLVSNLLGQKSQIDLPITWNDTANVDYSVTDFGGNAASLDADPNNAANIVLKVDKTNNAQTWAGTTLSTPSGVATALPFTATNTIVKAIVYSPDAGTVIRLKAEDHTNNTITVETEATTTKANDWDTLTFDFSAPVTGTPAINLSNTYDMISMFFDFGNMGTGKIYYLDDVYFYTVPAPMKNQIDLPITWNDTANVDYSVTDFGGNAASLDADPNNAANIVLKVDKTNNAQTWAGTTLSTPSGVATALPFTATNTIIKAIVYSPDAGTVIRLKAEDHTNNTITVETEATTTKANDWDTLTFDFSAPVTGTPAINLSNTYDMISMFFDFGNMGTGKIYYLDDVYFYTVPAPIKNQIDLPITWNDTANVDYSVTDFGGNASSLDADPNDAANIVLKSNKMVGAQTWAGTTLSTPMGLATAIPFAAGNTIIKAVVYSPDAGTVVRLKAEDHNDNTITVETEATTLLANAWDTLTFDFSNQATGTAVIDFAKTYDMLSVFYDFGNAGTGKDYLLDDVYMGTGGGNPTTPDTSEVTFKLNMKTYDGPSFTTPEVNGTFNSWCGSCTPMTDADNDSIWEATVKITLDVIEYKFSFDNWAGQEELDTALECTMTTGTFTNRVLDINGDTILATVCWEECIDCESTGINNNANFSSVSIFPNPTKDNLTLTGLSSVERLVITNVIGEIVSETTVNKDEMEISVSEFKEGVYFLNIIQNNNQNVVKRFIKM